METTVVIMQELPKNKQALLFPRIIDNDGSGIKYVFFTARGREAGWAGKAESLHWLYTQQPCLQRVSILQQNGWLTTWWLLSNGGSHVSRACRAASCNIQMTGCYGDLLPDLLTAIQSWCRWGKNTTQSKHLNIHCNCWTISCAFRCLAGLRTRRK